MEQPQPEQQQQPFHGYGNQIRQRTVHQKDDGDDATQKQLSESQDTVQKKKTKAKEKTVSETSKTFSCLKMLLLFIFFILVLFIAIIPLIFRFSLLIQRGTVFMNIVNFSLRTPEAVGLRCTRNWLLQLKVPSKSEGKETHSIRLGVWHVSPQEATCDDQVLVIENTSEPEKGSPRSYSKLNDGRLVVLYTHGMGGTRSSAHRVALYKLLSNRLQAHVIAFDYRGFGDSSFEHWPSSEGLAEDTHALYRWLIELEQVRPENILLWGHSMGTAVAIRFLSGISEELQLPLATVLESPFTSLREAIPVFPLAKIFSLLPHFNSCFLEPVVTNPRLNFDSSALMPRIKTPLLFLHAEDDRIVPYNLGRKLYNIALQQQPNSLKLRATFHSFPAERHYGHKNIVAAGEELANAVRQFMERVQKQGTS